MRFIRYLRRLYAFYWGLRRIRHRIEARFEARYNVDSDESGVIREWRACRWWQV